MAEFCGSEPVLVELGEPVPLIIKNKCKSSFSVATGIVFHDDGVYTILVNGNKITVLKENELLKEDELSKERKHGKWILHKDGSGTCSECHFRQANVWDLGNWQNFCGHCGADMREPLNESEK